MVHHHMHTGGTVIPAANTVGAGNGHQRGAGGGAAGRGWVTTDSVSWSEGLSLE